MASIRNNETERRDFKRKKKEKKEPKEKGGKFPPKRKTETKEGAESP